MSILSPCLLHPKIDKYLPIIKPIHLDKFRAIKVFYREDLITMPMGQQISSPREKSRGIILKLLYSKSTQPEKYLILKEVPSNKNKNCINTNLYLLALIRHCTLSVK